MHGRPRIPSLKTTGFKPWAFREGIRVFTPRESRLKVVHFYPAIPVQFYLAKYNSREKACAFGWSGVYVQKMSA